VASDRGPGSGCAVRDVAMPWLADTDVGADLVPADVVIWDRVELGTGDVRHEAVPAEAEPPGCGAGIADPQRAVRRSAARRRFH
jgi:hypothetical protein